MFLKGVLGVFGLAVVVGTFWGFNDVLRGIPCLAEHRLGIEGMLAIEVVGGAIVGLASCLLLRRR